MTSEVPLAHPRRRKFVDHRLQTSLIATLVGAQLVLVAFCVWQLDAHLRAVLDAQTYRVHFQAPPDSGGFRTEALELLALFVLVNLALVFLIEFAWRVYVGQLLRRYRRLLGRVRELDFTPDSAGTDWHPLLELTHGWRAAERERLRALQRCCIALDASSNDPSGQAGVMADVAALLVDPDLSLPR